MNRIESRFLSRGPVTPIPEDKEAIAKAEYEYLKGKFEAYEFFNKENFFQTEGEDYKTRRRLGR
jgi:hypothetical protein